MFEIDVNPKTELISKFITRIPEGNIFQTPEMKDVFNSTKNYETIFIAAVDQDKEIKASMLAVVQKEGVPIINDLSSRSIVWGGPLVDKESPRALNFILQEYNKIAKEKAIYTEIRNLWKTEQRNTFSSNNYDYYPHLNILVDLTVGEDLLYLNLSKSKRRSIKKSRKEGIIVDEASSIDEIREYYELLQRLYSDIKKPLPDWSFFKNAFLKLMPKNFIKYFLVKIDSQIIGGIMCPIFKNRIYEWYICSDKKYSKYFPSELATWAPIEWGSKNGLEVFDFMGAGKPGEEYGVRKFKEGFGGKTVELGRFKNTHSPHKLLIAEKGYEIYRRFR